MQGFVHRAFVCNFIEPLSYRVIHVAFKRQGPGENIGLHLAFFHLGDLLGVVMALSARTRRMAHDPARVEIDVFSPDGLRALRMTLGDD